MSTKVKPPQPTAAELRERDATGWGWTRPAESFDPTATPMELPEAPEAVEWLRVVEEARDKKRYPDPEAYWKTPGGQLWRQVLTHMGRLRTVTEAHGHAHAAHDVHLADTVDGLRAGLDREVRKTAALELDRERLAQQNADLAAQVAGLREAVAAADAKLEEALGLLLTFREQDAREVAALKATIAARTA